MEECNLLSKPGPPPPRRFGFIFHPVSSGLQLITAALHHTVSSELFCSEGGVGGGVLLDRRCAVVFQRNDICAAIFGRADPALSWCPSENGRSSFTILFLLLHYLFSFRRRD